MGQNTTLLVQNIEILFGGKTSKEFYFIVFREAIKSHNWLNLGNHPNMGTENEGDFPSSYFCYYSPQKKSPFKEGGAGRLGWFPKFNQL